MRRMRLVGLLAVAVLAAVIAAVIWCAAGRQQPRHELSAWYSQASHVPGYPAVGVEDGISARVRSEPARWPGNDRLQHQLSSVLLSTRMGGPNCDRMRLLRSGSQQCAGVLEQQHHVQRVSRTRLEIVPGIK